MRANSRFRIILSVTALALLVSVSGCSMFKSKDKDPNSTLPVGELYQKGVQAIDSNQDALAAAIFQRLISRFPFGAYTEQSQINLAYAQYKNDKPDDAYSTINRFIKTYPTHKHIDYAYYLRGLINFSRSGRFLENWVGQDMSQRDQANLRQSFDDFGELIKRYPRSIYVPDAHQRMVYLSNTMAQSDLNVAFYYLRRGVYVAAANRAKDVIQTYPQSYQVRDALAIMARSYRKLGQDQLAEQAESVLKLNYPEHAYFSGKWPDWHSNLWKILPLANRGQTVHE